MSNGFLKFYYYFYFHYYFYKSFVLRWASLLAQMVKTLLPKGLKSLLQHHSSKASVLWRSAFFIVQLSDQYMTTGKTIALTIWTFAGKVTSLLFNTLSRFVIAFLPRSKHLLVAQLQSLSVVILKLKKIKSVTVSIVSPYFHIFPVKWWNLIPWS